jgi:hypothetical protein
MNITNYCVSFVDLLGQKDAMRGESLFAGFSNAQEEKAFKRKIKDSIGGIHWLQKNAAHFLKDYPDKIIKRGKLTKSERTAYDEMKKMKMQQQRWSDGLVFFTSMQGKAPMNAIWEIFGTAGCLCLLGLAGKRPIRGSIEISWGVELHKGELSGPAVANSYVLESEIAQYPRIVVGNHAVNYLYVATQHTPTDKVDEYNCSLAEVCLQMISPDVDGYLILDYLGEAFTQAFTKHASKDLYEKALAYATAQLDFHAKNKNTKLAVRYNWLLAYMEAKGAIHA